MCNIVTTIAEIGIFAFLWVRIFVALYPDPYNTKTQYLYSIDLLGIVLICIAIVVSNIFHISINFHYLMQHLPDDFVGCLIATIILKKIGLYDELNNRKKKGSKDNAKDRNGNNTDPT